jgi:hypothetical protein
MNTFKVVIFNIYDTFKGGFLKSPESSSILKIIVLWEDDPTPAHDSQVALSKWMGIV